MGGGPQEFNCGVDPPALGAAPITRSRTGSAEIQTIEHTAKGKNYSYLILTHWISAGCTSSGFFCP